MHVLDASPHAMLQNSSLGTTKQVLAPKSKWNSAHHNIATAHARAV